MCAVALAVIYVLALTVLYVLALTVLCVYVRYGVGLGLRLGVAERGGKLLDLHVLVVDLHVLVVNLHVLVAHGRFLSLAHLQCVAHASAAVSVSAADVIDVRITQVSVRLFVKVLFAHGSARLRHQPSECEQTVVFGTPELHCGSPLSGERLYKSTQLEGKREGEREKGKGGGAPQRSAC